MRSKPGFIVAVAVLAGCAASCSDDDSPATDAAVDAPDAAIDAPAGDAGPCPGEVFFTGTYSVWTSTNGFPGINAATWTVRGDAARTAQSAPNGRIILCLVSSGVSTLDVTASNYLNAIYAADPAVFQPANTAFAVKGLMTADANTFYQTLGTTFDQAAGHVLVEKLGAPIPLTLGAGGTAYAVDSHDDNTWTAGNSGTFVLFTNVPIAAQTTLTSTSAFMGPTSLPLEAGKITITTIR
jgi:hypothetical protein